MSGGPVTTYDFTSFLPVEADAVCKHLRETCREWTFQKEKCPTTNNEHYQGRVHLARKMRLVQAKSELCTGPLAGAHISPTSSHNQGNNFYVMKVDTRVDGPWTSKEDDEYEYNGEAIVPELRPWQHKIAELCKIYEQRKIYFVIDKDGGIGKTTLVNYLYYHKLAIPLPDDIRCSRDLGRFVCGAVKIRRKLGFHNAFVVDLPRNAHSNADLWQSLERIKGGMAWEDRYAFQLPVQFTPPTLIVFTNHPPPANLYSAGRVEEIIPDTE